MCLEVTYLYHCGHQDLHHYIHCPDNLAANGEMPFEKCRSRGALIERENDLCPRRECRALSNSWACCECKQGPNTSKCCLRIITSAPEVICFHDFCYTCPGWDAFKKRQDEQRKALEVVKEE